MTHDPCVLVVIQPRPATGLVADIETEWFDQMQFSPVLAHMRMMLPVLGGISG